MGVEVFSRWRLAAQSKLVTPVLQVVHRMITRHLLGQAGLKAEEADSGAVTLIQRFGSAANIHLHCLVLDGVYRRSADGTPEFVEAPAASDEALQAVLHRIITRLTQAAHPSGGAGRRGGFDLRGRQRRRFGRGPHAQAAAGGGVYLPHRFRSPGRAEGADGAGRHAQVDGVQAKLRALFVPQEPETPAQSVGTSPWPGAANGLRLPTRDRSSDPATRAAGSPASEWLRDRWKRPEGKG